MATVTPKRYGERTREQAGIRTLRRELWAGPWRIVTLNPLAPYGRRWERPRSYPGLGLTMVAGPRVPMRTDTYGSSANPGISRS